MSEFDKAPTNMQRWLAAGLALIASIVLAGMTALFWFYAHLYLVGCIFAFLFLLSSWLFYRAVRTAPRPLRANEIAGLAWVFLILGSVAVIGSFFISGHNKLFFLGSGSSMVGMGLAGVLSKRA